MGDSAESSATSVGTLATPDAPTNLSASNATTTTIDISFTAGAQGGSAITNYQYALSTNGGSSYGAFTALNPADATSPITISGLTSNSAYDIKLKAVNNDGAGAESSTVSFSTAFNTDYLVLAGGAGGKNTPFGDGYGRGGGGAGGMRCTVTGTGGSGSLETALGLVGGTNYSVTVGGGGASGSNGSNSIFDTITSTGGGTGGGYPGLSGVSGGSGGGGGAGSGGSGGSGGAASPSGQGFAGGNGDVTGGYPSDAYGGGGGGAGAVGANAVNIGGNGGAGRATDISGSSVTYAGGGGGGGARSGVGGAGGGSGGSGGGGAGGAVNAAGSAASPANRGSGGGGASGDADIAANAGGAGSSGVVILRYPDTRTITIGAGLTGSTSAASGGYKRTTLTAGSGNVSWS